MAARTKNARLPPEVNRWDSVHGCTSIPFISLGVAYVKLGELRSCTTQKLFSSRSLGYLQTQPLMGMSSFCRVLYVRNLPFNISSEEMHDIFGKFGALRQIRL